MTKVAALGLPPVDDGCQVTRVQFNNFSTKNAITRDPQQLDAAISAKPFVGPSHDNIIVVYMTLNGRGCRMHLTLVVHPSVLLRHLSTRANTDMTPWHVWGPMTRCCRGLMMITSGQRCIVFMPWLEIWDFNPYRVRYLGRDFVMETETAILSVESKASPVTSMQHGVWSSLPYVKLRPKKWPKYNSAFLDDDRVFAHRVSNILVASYIQPFDMFGWIVQVGPAHERNRSSLFWIVVWTLDVRVGRMIKLL
jgi:hypothetical protein